MSNSKYIFNQVNSEEADLLINGEIDNWWGVGLSEVNQMLANSGASKINLQINSPGGSVTEGLAISAFIKAFPATINTTVIGLAASIATPIALAGDTVSIDRDSFFMIHNPWSFTAGEADDLREQADLLDKIQNQLADIYLAQIKKAGKLVSNRTDSTKKQIIDWMNNETWFTAQEALDAGLVDNIVNTKTVATKANAKSILNSCKNFKNAPVEFLNTFQTIVDMADNNQNKEEEAVEVSFFDKIKALFKSNPKEVKALIQDLDVDEKAQKEAKIAAAKELLKNEGIYKEPVEETEIEETVEETVQEDTSEIVALKKELEEANKAKETAQSKLQKIEEEKNAGPSAGDGGNANNNKQDKNIEKLYAPTDDHKKALKAVGRLFN